MYDVVVAGAGPAGAATALLLVRAGHHVALVDRAAFPRAKPCGDCISPGANRLLRQWGLWDDLLALRPALLTGWSIHSNGSGFTSSFPEQRGSDACSVALRRDRFDRLLRDAALAAGAVPLSGSVVGVLRDDHGVRGLRLHNAECERVEARLTIGADGLRSRVARAVGATAPPGRLRKVSLTAHVAGVRPGANGAIGELFLGDGFCIGLAPTGAEPASAYNLTIVAAARTHGPAIASDPATFMERTIALVPALHARLENVHPAQDAAMAEHHRGTETSGRGRDGGRFGTLLASGPFDRLTRFRVADGLALVGDAAGYYDPFTGQGIHAALAGAADLAEVADSALHDRRRPNARSLQAYEQRLRVRQRGVRALQQAVEWIVSRPALFATVAPRLTAAPRFTQGLLAATGDLATPASVLAPHRLARLLVAPRIHRRTDP